jgi:PAP2 superfamily protein
MLRHTSGELVALGLVLASVLFVAGCDPSTAPPAKTLSPVAPALADRGGRDTLVVGTNDPTLDVLHVQSAVDRGGNVVLRGHFSFAAPAARAIDPTIVGGFPHAAEILVSHSVNISGADDQDGEMATIDGGTIPFYVDAPGQRVTIDRVHFVQPTAAAILTFAASGLEVASNRIAGVVPFAGLASAIWVIPSGNIPTPTSLGHPENVSGSLRFVQNDIDMTGGTPTDNTLGISVFGAGIPGAEVDAEVIGNKISNVTEPAVNFRRIFGTARIEHNVIATGTVTGVSAPRNQVIRVVNTGRYVIAHNSVACDWSSADVEGIGVFSQFGSDGWPIQNALIEDNDIDMASPSGSAFTTFSGGIGLYGFAHDNVVRHNRIRGHARAGITMPVFPLTGTPAAPQNNVFIDNEFIRFTPTVADYFVGSNALDTRISGRGTVDDEGIGTIVSGLASSIHWNDITRAYISNAPAATKPNQQAALRAFAYLSLAQYRAVLAARELRGRGHSVAEQGAVSAASAAILGALFRADAPVFASQLAQQESEAAASDDAPHAFADGEAVGRNVASQVAYSAQTDGFDVVWTGSVPVGAGFWSSDFNPPRPPLLPLLGQMRPFFMTSGSQFRPVPPPAFGSQQYLDALAEIRRFSDTRTAEQLRIAKFWEMATGSLVAGFWNEEAATRIVRDHLGERRSAEVLAFMNMAGMDAIIACHDAKYTYWLIRPYRADPNINVPIGKPGHPSYPSNHACFSGTAAYVLGAFFPADAAQLAAMADEAGESRLYAGIHYRFDKDAGLAIARQVSALALAATGNFTRDERE